MAQYENLVAQVKGSSINFAISKLDMSRASVGYAKKGYLKSKESAQSLSSFNSDFSTSASKVFTSLYNSLKSATHYLGAPLSLMSHASSVSFSKKKPVKA